MIEDNETSHRIAFQCSKCKEPITAEDVIEKYDELVAIPDVEITTEDHYPSTVVSLIELISSKLKAEAYSELISLYHQLKP